VVRVAVATDDFETVSPRGLRASYIVVYDASCCPTPCKVKEYENRVPEIEAAFGELGDPGYGDSLSIAGALDADVIVVDPADDEELAWISLSGKKVVVARGARVERVVCFVASVVTRLGSAMRLPDIAEYRCRPQA